MIETFLSWQMRKASRRGLAFDPAGAGFQPRPAGNGPCLLYVHIPFCEQLCPYCSFNRVLFDPAVARKYFVSLRREMEVYQRLGFHFDALYVGGGTPTVMPGELGDVVDWARKAWSIRQVSVETNASHLSPSIVGLLKERGVNRLSVGVQTFDDGLLASIGRLQPHGSGQVMREKLAGVMGTFDTLNVDLIFNIPGQTRQMLEADIEIIHKLHTDQVTFYPLMASQTVQGDLRARFGRLSSRREKELYSVILSRMDGEYEPASAWCFSRGRGMIDEYIVRYRDYAGLGSGAFGYMDGTIYSNTFSVEEYIRQLDAGRLPVAASKRFPVAEQAAYDLLMGLFGNTLDLRELSARYGRRVWVHLWKELLFFLVTGGAVWDGGRLRVTRRGRYYLVALMREFFTGVNNLRESCAAMDRAR